MLACLSALCLPQHGSSAQYHLSWSPSTEVHHYIGYYEDQGVQKRFRTTSQWVLMDLPKGSHVKVFAIDEFGYPLGPVTLQQKLVAGPQNKSPVSTLAPQETDLPSEEPSTDDSNKDDPNNKEQTFDDALLFLDVDDPYAAPQVKRKAAKSLEPYRRAQERLLVLKLGAGQEKLQAVGGTSIYDGASSIGSTTLESFSLWENGWALSLKGEAHSFETVESKKVDPETTINESFLRTTFEIRVGFEILNSPQVVLIPQLGYYFSNIPLLSQIDQESGQTSFKAAGLGSLALGLKLYGHPSKKHRIGSQIGLFPLVGRSDLKGYHMDLEYNYFVKESWFIQVAALRSLGLANTTRSCPPLEECQETIKSTVITRQGVVGMGYQW